MKLDAQIGLHTHTLNALSCTVAFLHVLEIIIIAL